METRKESSKIVKNLISTVRGPGFLSALSLILLLAAIPANATLLRGYLNQDVTGTAVEPAADNTASADNVNAGRPAGKIETPTVAQGGPRTPQSSAPSAQKNSMQMQNAMVSANSFPISYEGAWKCITVVVDSAVPNIPVGERVESQVAFWPQQDGRIIARCNQDGWADTQEDINTLSSIEASMERMNYAVQRNRSTGWAAHSKDHYIQLDNNRIAASSSVDQFVNGQFLGEYKTRSMLFRLNNRLALASPN